MSGYVDPPLSGPAPTCQAEDTSVASGSWVGCQLPVSFDGEHKAMSCPILPGQLATHGQPRLIDPSRLAHHGRHQAPPATCPLARWPAGFFSNREIGKKPVVFLEIPKFEKKILKSRN